MKATIKKKVSLPEYIESIGIVGKYLSVDDDSMLYMFRKGYNTLGVPCDFLPKYMNTKVLISDSNFIKIKGE